LQRWHSLLEVAEAAIVVDEVVSEEDEVVTVVVAAVSQEVVVEEEEQIVVVEVAVVVLVAAEELPEEDAVHQEEDVEEERREVQRPLSSPIVMKEFSLPVARKICWSPRTLVLVNPFMAKSASVSRVQALQTKMALLVPRK